MKQGQEFFIVIWTEIEGMNSAWNVQLSPAQHPVTKSCFVIMFLNRILLHRSLEEYHWKILSLFCKKTSKKSNSSQGQALTVIVRQLWPLWNVLLWVSITLQTHLCLKAVFSNMLKSWLLILIWYGVESTESAGVLFVTCCLLFHLLLVRDYQQGNSSSSLWVTAEYAPQKYWLLRQTHLPIPA